MQLLDNINHLLGDDLKQSIKPDSRLKIAASCFSIYAYEALKQELEKVDGLQFIFTAPTFTADEVTDKVTKERREFHIPKLDREKSLYGTEFEIQLRNKLTQRAIAKECADWLRRKATFKSNKSRAPMQQFACVQSEGLDTAYIPLHGFTAVDLGYQQGNAVSNLVNKMDDKSFTSSYLTLFEQIWNDTDKLEDVTTQICDHIASVYQENSPERIYFLILYNIFNEFLEDLDEDVLPNDRTGYQETQIWKKLFNFQKDAATGIINKLETYNGCILADSVGLGKTFTALAVVKYYELRNKSVLVLCPKKLADNWLNYNRNLKTNIFSQDRFNYDVLAHTDLSRTSGESFGTPLNRINWGNYDLVVIDESHNFRNNDAYKDKETRYQKLMNQVIRQGVKTKVLMLSATPVNNRFTDLRNQLALAYEGDSENLTKRLKTGKSVEDIFRNAQLAFNRWAKLPSEERTARAILDSLDFDFFELLDSVTIARSRKHIQTFYDTTDIGKFPERLKPLSFNCKLTHRTDVMSFNEIFEQLSLLKLSVYAPVSYILPSRLKKYEDMYDTQVEGNRGKLRQLDLDNDGGDTIGKGNNYSFTLIGEVSEQAEEASELSHEDEEEEEEEEGDDELAIAARSFFAMYAFVTQYCDEDADRPIHLYMDDEDDGGEVSKTLIAQLSPLFPNDQILAICEDDPQSGHGPGGELTTWNGLATVITNTGLYHVKSNGKSGY